jgi:hypothetical protein
MSAPPSESNNDESDIELDNVQVDENSLPECMPFSIHLLVHYLTEIKMHKHSPCNHLELLMLQLLMLLRMKS